MTKRILKLMLLCLIAYSCKTKKELRLHGDWQEYRNDTVVVDYVFTHDTILRKYPGMCWFEAVPVFFKDNIYYKKQDSTEVIKIISQIDSNSLIVNSGNSSNCKFLKLIDQKRILPNSITFDLIDKISSNDSCKEKGLGDSDFKLNQDGSYSFFIHKELHHGKISNDLKSKLDFFLSSIDTSNKYYTEHTFEIHQTKFEYKLTLNYTDRTDTYLITDKQPVKFTRVTLCLETIWYKILNNSGYRIL